MDTPNYRHEVSVRDIDMPFWSMVWFMIKWSVAAIPAMTVLFCVGSILVALGLFFLALLGAGLNLPK
jgi:hypothetical protein